MRAILPLLALSVACAPPTTAPPLELQGALRTEGGVEVWWTDPGTAPGEEQDSEVDDSLVALIDAATTTLDLALYEFDLPEVITAVEDAWDRGVDVRMVGDGDEVHDAGYVALDALGVPMELRPAGSRIMHHKFAVVDGQAVWTGSANVSHNGMNRNNNHAVVLRSSDMAAAYTHEFEQMYGGEFGRGKTTFESTRSMALADGSVGWFFAPTHDPIHVVVDAIDQADHSVAFMVFSFTHMDVVDALERAHDRGVEVLGIFDESQANGAWSVDETLAEAGVPVMIDGNKNASGFSGGKLHHKVLVVDAGTSSATVVSGSMNWSNAGTGDNDENLLLIESPSLAAPMMAEFCALADVATVHPSFDGTLPEICEGTTIVPEDVPSVVINEVHAASARLHTGHHFVELVSGEDTPVDLAGWRLVTRDGHVVHTFGDVELGAGEVMVLVGPEWSGATEHTVQATGMLPQGFSERLILEDAVGALVDSFPMVDVPAEGSLNRWFDGQAGAEVGAHTALTASGRRASPGLRMDGGAWSDAPTVPSFVMNELMPNPAGTDLGAEYVELVNAGTVPLDPTGWTLCDASGVCHTFGPPALLPGEALVLFDRGDHSDVPGARGAESERLSLNNSGETVTLTEPDGTVHDEVYWSSCTEGMSLNRSTDGTPGATLVRHDQVQGAGADSSAGFRADGTDW